MEPNPTPPTEDQLHAAFDALLEPTFTTGEGGEQEPEPAPEPTPEPSPEPEPETPPAAVAKAPEPPKIDKRTREGKKLSIQQQIDAETARKYQAKQEADAEEARLATLRAERARLETAPAAKAEPAPPQPPTQADFKRYLAMPDAPKPDTFTGENAWQEYQFAVSEFVADKRFAENMGRYQQQQQIAQRQTVFQDRMQKEASTDPTFTQKVNSTPVDTRIIPYLHQHTHGPDVMVYLVQHPDIAQRLTTLTPVEQIGEIGEIVGLIKASAAASSGPASKPSAISHAKPVIKPVTASPDVGNDDDDGDEENISVDEHIRRGNKAEGRAFPRAARY